MKIKLILSKENGTKVGNFLRGEAGNFCLFSTTNNNGESLSVLLFHGYEDPMMNLAISEKIAKFFGDREVKFLCCHGNLFPQWVKANHIMPRNGEVSGALHPREKFDLLVVSD